MQNDGTAGARGCSLAFLAFSALGASCGGHARWDSVEDSGRAGTGGSAASGGTSSRWLSWSALLRWRAGVVNPGGKRERRRLMRPLSSPHALRPTTASRRIRTANGSSSPRRAQMPGAPVGPPRGHARDVCGTIGLETTACAMPDGGRPCLELSSDQRVKYVDGNGTVFLGSTVEISVDESIWECQRAGRSTRPKKGIVRDAFSRRRR